MRLIWLASYPRSGNTWLRFLLSAYFFGSLDQWSDQRRVVRELHQLLRNADRDGHTREQVFETLKRETRDESDRHGFAESAMLKTHFLPGGEHPWFERTDRVVYLIRHPRDVLVSALNYRRWFGVFRRMSDAEYARRFIEGGGDPGWIRAGYGAWAEHAERWHDLDVPFHTLRYESLKGAPRESIASLLTFLGREPDPLRIDAAIRAASLERVQELERRERASGATPTKGDSRSFINRGAVGQSLDDIAPGLDEAFAERFGPSLERWGYEA